jgi:hypothetical protein
VSLDISGWSPSELEELARAQHLGDRLKVVPAKGLSAADLEPTPAMAGAFSLEGPVLRFEPRYPFIAGRAYALVLTRASGPPEVYEVRLGPRAPAASARVVAVYPTAAVVPVNLLRLYLYFSAPMSTDQARESVKLLRAADGSAMPDVFVQGTELWDRERRRLTLLLDPARIKRGLVPNLEAGYPLREGEAFVLRVERSFRDGTGADLEAPFERRYETGPELRGRVDPNSWRLQAPEAGSRKPLRPGFGRPLDRALLQRCLSVVDPGGRALAGDAIAVHGEQEWSFAPRRPWGAGEHAVIVAPELEDVAGNSVQRVFDRDLELAEDAPREGGPVRLRFVCA